MQCAIWQHSNHSLNTCQFHGKNAHLGIDNQCVIENQIKLEYVALPTPQPTYTQVVGYNSKPALDPIFTY